MGVNVGFLDVTRVDDITNAESLKQRIFEYIDYAVCHTNGPAKLATVNKRFGVKASTLGQTVRNCVSDLEDAGKVKVFSHNRSTVLMPTYLLEEQIELFEDDVSGRIRALNMILDRAE